MTSDQGIFVDGNGGSDSNDGSKQSRVKTIGKGIELAKTSGKSSIFVCAADKAYAEQVQLAAVGVSLYGGFDCTSWVFNDGSKSIVQPAATGSALTISNAPAGVIISDMEFDSLDAKSAGESSIAIFVSNSPDVVTFRRVIAKAGNGIAGADGSTGQQSSILDENGKPKDSADGQSTKDSAGALVNVCVCSLDNSRSTGGKGGDSYNKTPEHANANGGDGSASQMPTKAEPPNPDGWGTGGAGSGGGAGAAGGGSNGAPADIGGAASDSPPSLGALSSTDWAPANGCNGKNGNPGQGGGGGGGGNGGQGGGSSIAIASYQSSISLDTCNLYGGAGGAGGAPGVGGLGGGGNGGQGSGGAGGGGGAGGLSVGIVYVGAEPSGVDTCTITPGNAGQSGGGGDGGSCPLDACVPGTDSAPGASGNPGPNGISRDIWQVGAP